MLINFEKLFPKYNLTFTGVLHVGANVGEEAPVYENLGIKKQLWIEANPEIFQILEQKISNNLSACAFNIAAGDENKKINLHVSNNNSQSSSVLDLGTHKQEHPDVHYVKDIEVSMYRLDDFFEGTGLLQYVDLLNIDVQGFEGNVLKGMGDLLNQFKAIYIEVNKDYVYKDCLLVEDLDFYLGSYGFTRVETRWAPNKNWGDALYVRNF